MEKQLLKDVPVAQRATLLRDNCYKVLEDESYTRNLSETELAEKKNQLFERVEKIENLKAELKEIKRDYNERIKSLETDKKELLQVIKFGAERKKGTLYAMDDQDAGIMGLYDEEGNLVMTRPLTPDERQASILTIKTGTDE